MSQLFLIKTHDFSLQIVDKTHHKTKQKLVNHGQIMVNHGQIMVKSWLN